MTIRNGEEGGRAVRRAVSPSPRAEAPNVGAGEVEAASPGGEHSTIVVTTPHIDDWMDWVDQRAVQLRRRGRCS